MIEKICIDCKRTYTIKDKSANIDSNNPILKIDNFTLNLNKCVTCNYFDYNQYLIKLETSLPKIRRKYYGFK